MQVVGASVGDDEPLMSAGLDSLGSVEFANVLSQKLGLQVPSTLVFDHPTVAAVTVYLAAQMLKSAAAAAAAAGPEALQDEPADALPVASQDAELACFGESGALSAEVAPGQRHLAVSAVAARSLMAEAFVAPEQVARLNQPQSAYKLCARRCVVPTPLPPLCCDPGEGHAVGRPHPPAAPRALGSGPRRAAAGRRAHAVRPVWRLPG